MRAAPQKIIRAVFELHFRGRERVSSIQDRVSAFAGDRFHAVMAEGLSGMGRDRLLVFERVELDVGEVCISRLEDDLAAGIARCLKRWAFTASPSRSSLLAYFSNDGSGRSNDASRQDSLEMRQQRAGQRNSTTSGLSAAVAAALQEPVDWSEFLAALRENHALRCRLADEVSPKLLRRLAAALAPAEGPRIAEYAEEMIRLHERQPLLAVNVYVFRRAVWEGIFCELAMRQPGGPNHSLFIQRILRRMARRHSCAYSEVANNLTLALKQNSSRAPMHDLLRQTAAELKAASPDSEPTHSSFTPLDDCQGSTITGNVSRRIDDLAKFLELGVLPWTLIAQGPETELLDLLATAPDELSAAILKLSAIEPVRKRLSSQFREGAASRLLATLAPGAASWMIAYMRQLRRIHAQKPLFPVSNRRFGQELWESCFEYLSQRSWENLSRSCFLKFLLLRLAARRKTTYETLLVEVALRRGNTPETREGLGSTLIALLDETMLGLARAEREATRLLIKPEYRLCYSDLDVLGHWLRWRKLPRWSHASDPEDTGRRLGAILRTLPAEIQAYARKPSTHSSGEPKAGGWEGAPPLSTVEQIGRWLSFGIWPGAITVADQAQLEAWLANQSDADWLKALEASGAQEAVIARIIRQLPEPLQERITRLLAGNAAGLTLDYLRRLDAAGRRVAPVATQVWVEHLRKYTLIYLLRAASVSGRHTISVSDLARSTMLALALNCRVPYERLLDEVEQESRKDNEMQDLCRFLRHQLEAEESDDSGLEPASFVASDAYVARSIEVQELVLHYLQRGSMPEIASGMSLSSLQRAAAHLSVAEIDEIATACCGGSVLSLEKARRIATLFSKKSFARFASAGLASTTLADELEEAACELARSLSTPVQPLLVAARTFLLRLMTPARTQTSEENNLRACLPHLVQEIARLSGILPELVGRELRLITKNSEILSKSILEIFPQRKTEDVHLEPAVFCQNEPLLQSKAIGSVTVTHPDMQASGDQKIAPFHDQLAGPKQIHSQLFASEHTTIAWAEGAQSKVAALDYFLRSGCLPWWGENLAQESCREWVGASLTQNPQLLLDILRPLSAQPKALQRLTRYLSKSELEKIVCAAAPECGGLLILYISVGEEFESRNAAGQSSARSVHWQESLSFLLDRQRAKLSPLETLRQLSVRTSQSLKLDQECYASSLLQIVHGRRDGGNVYAALTGILEQLLPPDLPDAGTIEPGAAIEPAEAGEKKITRELMSAKTEILERQEEAGSHKSLAFCDVSPIEPRVKPRGDKDFLSNSGSEEFAPLDAVVEIGPQSDPLQQLDFLLRYGALPENEDKGNEQKLTARVMEDMGKRAIQYRRYLLQAGGREVERKRMVRLFPEPLLAQLWPLLLPGDYASAVLQMEILEEAASIVPTGAIARGCREIVVEQLLHAIVASQYRRWDAAVFFHSAVEHLSERLEIRPALLMRRVRAIGESKSDNIQKELKPVIERVELETAAMPRLRAASPIPREKDQRGGEARVSRHMPEGEPFYIGNAGLVLLWPFLQQYFRRLDLTDEKNAFRDEHAQSRAAHLMQYLATGRLEASDHQLLLNKILAGAVPEQPLEAPAPLSEREESLSDQLLHGVLKNWDKLKNTSIQGLRASFLIREGKLLLKDEAWSLMVSAKGYDMLLDSLPWRLSPVRLPYMKTVVHVKWR